MTIQIEFLGVQLVCTGNYQSEEVGQMYETDLAVFIGLLIIAYINLKQ